MKFENELLNKNREQIDLLKAALQNNGGVFSEEKKGEVAGMVVSKEEMETVVAADQIRGNFAQIAEVAFAELAGQEFVKNPELEDVTLSIGFGRGKLEGRMTAHKLQKNNFAKEGEPEFMDKYMTTTLKYVMPGVPNIKNIRKAYQEEFETAYKPIHANKKQA